MKKGWIYTLMVVSLIACRKDDIIPKEPKEPQEPEMVYTDLQNAVVTQGVSKTIDLDKDGARDIVFTTWYIGDPVEKEDEVLYFAGSYIHSLLLSDASNQSPVYSKDAIIPGGNIPGYNWYEVGQIEMAMKNIPMQGAPYWEGAWQDVSHKYLGVQVKKDGRYYTGWVEVSFNKANGNLILHKAAISKVAGKDIHAGR